MKKVCIHKRQRTSALQLCLDSLAKVRKGASDSERPNKGWHGTAKTITIPHAHTEAHTNVHIDNDDDDNKVLQEND